jgi:hypothetical protein
VSEFKKNKKSINYNSVTFCVIIKMKLLIVLVLFGGIILIMNGIYQERINEADKRVKIEYRFTPRSYYDEQLFSSQFESKFSNLFNEEQDQWMANQRLFEPVNDKGEKMV